MTKNRKWYHNLAEKSTEVALLSFVLVVIIFLIFSRPLRCVLEYRLDEARVALVAVLLSCVGTVFTRITMRSQVPEVLWYCILGGSAALFLCLLVVMFLPPPPPGDCPYPTAPPPPPPTPTDTATSGIPTDTATPGIPTDTATPGMPTDTATPGMPTDTATPGMPTDTATPGMPTDTAMPDMPTDTATPGMPTATHPPTVESTGKIAYPVYKSNREYIFIAYLEGDEVRSVLFKEDASEPAISPDGSKIAFRSWNEATRGLMVMNIDGTNLQRVSRGLEDACPYWALGESLVFHSTRAGSTPRLYTAGTWEGANGLNNVQDMKWATAPVYGRYPAWVPDRRIVYEYFDQGGNYHGLYIINSDGSNPVPITDHPGDTMPSVSPDGDRVAFMSDRSLSGHWEVYVVNIDGSGLRQLTDSGGRNSGLPTWSPDGNHIAFVSDRDNQWAIWVINYDGSGERKLFDLDSPLEWWEHISWGP